MRREYLYDRAGLPGSAGSTWLAGRERDPFPTFSGAADCDVAVVGAGMTGVLTALRLAEGGADVVLLEGRRLCSDVSGHTTAKATAQHGLITANVPEHAREPWLAENVRAIDRLEQRAANVGGHAGFARAASVLYTTRPDGVDDLRRELDLYCGLGLRASMVDGPGLPVGVHGAVRLESQAMIDPVGFCDALIAQAPAGVRIHELSMVRSVDEERGRVVVGTDGGQVNADALVVATHVPFFDTLMYSTRLFQEMTYALEIKVPDAPEGMWYSEDSPSLSWRPVSRADPHRLVVSGFQHKSGHGGDEREHYEALVSACRERFGDVSVVRSWSTQDPSTPDGLPLIGKMIGRDRCYVATGYNGWGMSSSEVAAEILSVLIEGGDHGLADIVSPLRVGTSGLVTLAVENADFVAKAFTQEVVSVGRLEDVGPGEGRAMRVHGDHLAVARDADGTLHTSDAHCAHMRCGVEFNEAEGTWDCPCHGSRFYGDGSWLHGPAKRSLEHVDVEEG